MSYENRNDLFLREQTLSQQLEAVGEGSNVIKGVENKYLIRKHGEPEYSDSEGFEYVKTYSGMSLTWTYSAQRAKHVPYAEACEVQRRLREVQTECEIIPAPAGTNCSTLELSKPVEELKLRTVTNDDWTIKKAKSGKFCITRTSDGTFLKGVIVQTDTVGYMWGVTEEEARQFDSLAAASDYASEVLLLQTYRGLESKALGLKCPKEGVFILSHGSSTVGPKPKICRNDPCPCGSGKKWKRCCMR